MTRLAVELKKGLPAVMTGMEPFQVFAGQMDRMFDRFTEGFGLPSLRTVFNAEPMWAGTTAFTGLGPAVDVTEDEKAYTVTAELPGLEEKDVTVTVAGDALRIKGEKRVEKEEKAKNYYVSEREFGTFERVFALPEGVDRGAVEAAFAKGILTVTLPKTAEALTEEKKIEIKKAA